ncbi:hypothetical protein A2U01_0086914, partial [Trifolium medium]|nr:hypothetical protein [Trifolium medium]
NKIMGRKKQPAESPPVEKSTKKPRRTKGAKSKSGPGSSSQTQHSAPQIPVLQGQPLPLEKRFMSQEAFE